MGEYEQTRSERKRESRPTAKVNEISRNISSAYENQIKKENRQRELYQRYGNGLYTTKGTVDRLAGNPYDDSNLSKEADKISYYNGYYERGTRCIRIAIELGKIEIDGLSVSPEEFQTMLKKIAMNDGADRKIDFDSLPAIIKNNPIYTEYFEYGRKNIKGQGKK